MLSSSNIGMELPRDVDPSVNWKTAPKGRRRAVRRARTSFAGDSNRPKSVTTSSNGSDNASDEESKETDQVLVSESEKLGVTILGRRFSDTIQSMPIKKRMRLLTGCPAPFALDSSQASTPEAGRASSVESSLYDNHIDFSGISILADAACKSDLPDEDTDNCPVSEVQSPKGENRVVMPSETSEIQLLEGGNGSVVPLESSSIHIETTEVLNDGSDKSSKAEKLSTPRFNWDLNTVMDTWDSDQQEGSSVADYEQKDADMACKLEVCKDHKEEAQEKIGNEDQEITVRNDGDALVVAAPKGSFEFHGTELRKEGGIDTEVNPKDSNPESLSLPSNCPVVISPLSDPSSAKEVKSDNEPYSNVLCASEHEHSSMCKPEEVKADNEGAGSTIDGPLEVNPEMQPTNGSEPISEEGTNESVATSAPDSEAKDAMTGDDQVGIDAMMGDNRVEHDSMIGDDKVEHGVTQSNSVSGSDQLVDEKNHIGPLDIETGLMLTIGNVEDHSTDDRKKVDQKEDPSLSDKVGVKVDKFSTPVEFHNDGDHSDFHPPKKDQEEDDYQYEDGELREPSTQYWKTEGFQVAEAEIAPCEAEERGENLMEPVADAPVMVSLSLDASQREETLLVADTGVQLENCMDTSEVAEMDLKSDNQIEWLENGLANSGGENGVAEYASSSRLKTTGWDKLPESSRKSSESPLKQEDRPGSSVFRRDLSLRIEKPRSSGDPYRNDKFTVRSRRSREDDLDARADRNPRAPRLRGRGGPSRHYDPGRKDEHWIETRICTARTRHRTPEFSAPSYAPSNSGNATAASIAKVQSNGFVVAPDGTIVKASGSQSSMKCQNSSSFYGGSPSNGDHQGFRSSRERITSPDRFGCTRGGRPARYGVEPAREQYHRPIIGEISPGPRRQRSFSPHRGGHIHHISPSHVGSPRSRARSPNTWVSPSVRGRHLSDHEPRHETGRSPLHRVEPDYDDRLGDLNLAHRSHHNLSPHGVRCVNDRRCTSPVNFRRRSPPRNARFHPLDSPPPPLHRPRDEFYHRPVHSSRCNDFDRRRGFEEDRYEMPRPERLFERSVDGDGFRPRNSGQQASVSHRRGGPRGLYRNLAGDVNHRNKDGRDNFKFGTGARRNNGKYEKREMPDRSGDDDDATLRRRLS